MSSQPPERRGAARRFEELDSRRDAGLFREMRDARAAEPRTAVDGEEMLVLCSNDYLGLASHDALADAAAEAAREYGTGAGASRLVSGNLEPHRALEDAMAELKGTEAALAFSSGYAANVGTIAALVGDEDVVVSDALNHASIVDGCRSSGADVAVYDHADHEDLEKTLAEVAPVARRTLVVTDSVFSMDGDVAPLDAVCDAAEAHDALVMIDEAHATGVLGPGGSGEVAAQAVGDRVDVQLATCSKALGSQGGVVCADADVVDLLVNEARSFVYSTGLSPVDAAVADRAVRLVRGDEGSERRARLFDNVERLADGLGDAGFEVPDVMTQILPVIVGDPDDAVALDAALERRGVFAAAIRPPTVPEGTSRIRVSATASHTPEQIDEAVEAFVAAGEEVGVI